MSHLKVLDEFLLFASSSKCFAPKDLEEVCSVTRAVMSSADGLFNDYPDHYNQAFAFSTILYLTFC